MPILTMNELWATSIGIGISQRREKALAGHFFLHRHGPVGPYRMHRSWNRSAAAIATSSWPGFSGPSVAAPAGIGGHDHPGHDDGETLAAIEQAFDFIAVSEMCASRRDTPGHDTV